MSTRYYSAAAEKEYKGYIEAPETFPVSFSYGGKHCKGFSADDFATLDFHASSDDLKETNTYTFLLDDTLKVTLDTAFFRNYGVYNWTVWFENVSSENSKVLTDVLAADMTFNGAAPVLSGVLGDHESQHAPYTYDLTKKPVEFKNTIGRACHITFPYFTLLTDDISATISIGWGGTWQANFDYNGAVSFKGLGTLGFSSYLRPGEKVRTPLMTIARFNGRDEEFSANQWRKWYFDCWMPRENGKPIAPFTTSCLANDTGKPNSDGSISEDQFTWKPSLEKCFAEGIRLDYRWIDAGWYCDGANNDIGQDWFGSVGTWEVDHGKWPDNALLESVKYAEKHGTKTLMWFEPERVCHVDALIKNYGYKREWALGDDTELHDYHQLGFSLNNLGDPECLKWTYDRIIYTMDKHGIHMYREDFNTEPAKFWNIGDEQQGENRKGITENLYMQGHYMLWDMIIEDCKKKGKTTWVDICASGGGRNDMESMRRGIPLLRSDADRTTTALRLSFTMSLAKWIPFAGCSVKEAADELETGIFDEYVWRVSMVPVYNYGFEFAHDPTINYDEVRRGIKEWEGVSPFLSKEFYAQTPWHTATDKTGWTVFTYFDSDEGRGVMQAFRREENNDAEYTVKCSFADENKVYDLCDIDKGNSFAGISGKELRDGLTLKLDAPRTAAIIYINEK